MRKIHSLCGSGGVAMIITCPACGTKNRIPAERLKDRPICGKCRKPLPAATMPDHPVTVTDETFKKEVLLFPGIVLVDCWAPWCGPCRMLSPILDELASAYAGRMKVVKLNVDDNPGIASHYETRSIPTMLFFKEGQLVNRLVGALPKNQIEEHIRQLLH
jgi:thioredoxin 2